MKRIGRTPARIGLLLAGLGLGACSAPDVLLLEGEGPGAVQVQRAGDSLRLSRPGEAVSFAGGPVLHREDAAVAPAWVASALPPRPVRFRLYFRDWNHLTEDSERLFGQVLAAMRLHAPAVVRVVGHTDSLGDARHNEQVGLRRARRLAQRLQRSGIEVLQLQAVSHGEADPWIATPDETYEPRNRRVEVWVQ